MVYLSNQSTTQKRVLKIVDYCWYNSFQVNFIWFLINVVATLLNNVFFY